MVQPYSMTDNFLWITFICIHTWWVYRDALSWQYRDVGACWDNWDKDDYIAAYFPEVGIVMDFTKTFGITVSGKRYFNLYEEGEDIVMLGLEFRK